MKLRGALQAFFLAFLLLSLQLEARVHPLTHVGEQLRAAAQKGTVASSAVSCATCDLLAGGCDTPSSEPALPVLSAASLEAALPVASSRACAPFVAYLSRAPPAIP